VDTITASAKIASTLDGNKYVVTVLPGNGPTGLPEDVEIRYSK
jgi:hypothetical protein